MLSNWVLFCWDIKVFPWHKSSQRKDDISYKSLFNILKCYRADNCKFSYYFLYTKSVFLLLLPCCRKALKGKTETMFSFMLITIYTRNKTAVLAYCCKKACTQKTFPSCVACFIVTVLMKGKHIQLAVTWVLLVFFSKWWLFKDLSSTSCFT